MSDWVFFPAGGSAGASMERRSNRPVAAWLWIVAALVFAMVLVGGATRLTQSGLSITQWQPLAGVAPPLDDADWQAEFSRYKAIPQYAQLFPDMDLARFKAIYYWEWGHRLLGRLIGLAMAVPLLGFALAGRISPVLGLQLLGVLALGGLQGFVGWWMVQSGLSERVDVSQYRLALHLLLASLAFAALVWIATGLRARSGQAGRGRLRGWASWLVLLLFLQIGMGALVAGLHAGRDYNTWPLMDGRLAPPLADLARLSPLWSNLFENIAAVQFQHRMTAYLVVALAFAQALAATGLGGAARARALAIAGLALAQAGIGVAALLLGVPLWAGLLHQGGALLLLGMAVAHRRALA